jgi:hypothetical protein
MENCVYFRTYDDKMILYIVNGNHVVQKVRDVDGKVYKYTITLNIFEQLRKEFDLWQIKI